MRQLNTSELAHVAGGANPHLTTISITTNPGGSSDSGASWSCPSAGSPAASSASPTAAMAVLLGEIFKRHGLFNAHRLDFGIAPGEPEQAADQRGDDDDQKDKRTGH